MAGEKQDELVGRTLGGFEVVERLGRGGMGCVYLAREQALDRFVALKVMLAAASADDSLVQRFEREAKAAARLSHPNIVPVYTVGEDQGVAFIAMEYVEGQTLDSLLRQHGRLPWRYALKLTLQITAALACAHRQGVVHRDIKPGNILIDKEGRVRVADFGLAKLQTADTQLTSGGAFLGTPQYVSPEQCGVGDVGPKSDLFALGVVLYEMLAGRRPFEGETPASLVRSITLDPPQPLRETAVGLPEAVYALADSLLAKAPECRPASAEAVGAEIRRIGREQASSSAATTPGPSVQGLPELKSQSGAERRPWWRRNARRLGIAGALLLVAFVLAVAAKRARRDEGSGPAAGPVQDTGFRVERQEYGGTLYGRAGDMALFPVGWNSRGSAFVGTAIGQSGRVASRMSTIFTMDIEAMRAEVHTSLPLMAFGQRREGMLAPELVIPRVSDASPFRDKVLVLRPSPPGEGRGPRQVLEAHSMGGAGPTQTLFETALPRLREGGLRQVTWCRRFAVHPTEDRLCLVLSKGFPAEEAFLVEKDAGGREPGAVPPKLASHDGPIGAVAYSLEGGFVVYDAVGDSGGELLVVPRPGVSPGTPKPLFRHEGEVLNMCFGPRMDHLLVSVLPPRSDEPDIILLNLEKPEPDTGRPRPVFVCKGRISDFAWSTSDACFYVASGDGDRVLRYRPPNLDRPEPVVSTQKADIGTPPANAGVRLPGPVVSPDNSLALVAFPGTPPRMEIVRLE